jgi:uncharacterized protein
MRSVLLDAGPIIALFDRSDRHHRRAVGFIERLNRELHTTIPIIAEVLANLDFSTNAQIVALSWVRQTAEIHASTDDLARITEIMDKYRDMPADFGDASLVALAERIGTLEVATIDSDFDIYRTKEKRRFTNVFLKR